jgi:MoxR-like ATPase
MNAAESGGNRKPYTPAPVTPPDTAGAPVTDPDWWVYRCASEPHDGINQLPPAPPWRSFAQPAEPEEILDPPLVTAGSAERRQLGRQVQAVTYQADREEIHLVNMALLLRRPLLVIGRPGVGKSTLAYSIARDLRLGPVLRWPVTSRTVLQDGQYHYDAIGRLQDVSLREQTVKRGRQPGEGGSAQSRRDGRGYLSGRVADDPAKGQPPDIGRYLRLGPLGTALLPWRTPRVLLIDEIDKSDVDFPNDLLHVFEEGEFTIPELARLNRPKAQVMTADDGGWAELRHGRVHCNEFPIVVMTSNEERELSPAFLRRCIRLEIRQPDRAKLTRLLAAHLPESEGPPLAVREQLIAEFLKKQDEDGAELANDQLLNAVRVAQRIWNDPEERDLIRDHLLRPLNEG